MITAISDYTIAAANGSAAFVNIKEIKLLTNEQGVPLTQTTSSHIQFEALWHDTPCRIYCPLGHAAECAAERLSAVLKRCHSTHLVGYRLLPKEMIVGNRLCDIVIEILPEGTTLRSLLDQRPTPAQARALASAWLDCVEELGALDFAHRALNTSRIIVCEGGEMSLCALHHGRFGSSSDDNKAIVEITFEILRAAMPHNTFPKVEELLAASDRATLCATLREIVGTAKVKPQKSESKTLCQHQHITRKLLDKVDFSMREWIDIPSEDRIAFREEGRYGYLDLLNRVVIEAQFLNAEPFHEGRAVVETDNGCGLINKQGEWIIAPEHEDICWSADYNIATVGGEHGWALYDSLGHRISPYYDYLGDCQEHRLTACRDNRWGFIDTHGCEVVALLYDDAFGYKNGRARVVLNGRPLEIDLDGLEIL